MKYRVLSVFAVALLATCLGFAQIADNTITPATPGFSSGSSHSTITGTVLSMSGTPVRDARIELLDGNSRQVVASGYSLPGGIFTFDDVPPGNYEVRATVGLQEVHERIQLAGFNRDLTLRVPDANHGASNDGTVSLAELRIPDKAKSEFKKAEEAFTRQKLDAARAHCAKSLKIAPTYSRALTLHALLQMMDNKPDAALQSAQAAVKSDPGYGMGYVVLGSLDNAMKHYDEAIRVLETAMPLVPAAWQTHFEIARAFLGKGDFHQALSSIDRAVAMAPAKYAPVHLVRAHALLGLKAYSAAVVELEKCIGADPDGVSSDEARRTLGEVKAFMATAQK